ncbi:HlyC/CorC family transporter [Prosthecomicrobium hirschii]|uniref:hemolysin family protein n=1 Tax=Prosthecodimorpha hirschii TaxID=665126 RepID=UPI001128307E|nr:hemolysin family protein [Prosthecomicrobium hirschii]TPQ50509.1 HlyC/CorC family transporter [Prosthecomicrobium hirschii]
MDQEGLGARVHGMIGLELLFFFALTLVNGFFAMSEMALVSARRARLGPLAESGDLRAQRAIELGENPTRFLSSVQIGITVTGLLAGAASGAALAGRFAEFLIFAAPGIQAWADEIAFTVVIVFMTFVTLIFGELVPKRIAIAAPEPIALWVAGPISVVSRIASPFVGLLSIASNAVLTLFGVRESTGGEVTEEEVMHVLAEGVQAGVLDPEERELLEGVMRVADRPVRAIMTPRPDLYWIDPNDPSEQMRREIAECPYSLVVVATGSIDEPTGVVYKKDLLADALAGRPVDIAAALREPIVVPENAQVLKLLETFRGTPTHCAFVVDEYGSLQGLITLTDIIEGIAGDLADVDAPHGGPVRRDDGSWLLDGDTDIGDLERLVDLPELEHGSYHTLGGLMLSVLNRIPTEGEKAVIGDFVFEVMDMDGRRIDKVLISPRPTGRAVPEEDVA